MTEADLESIRVAINEHPEISAHLLHGLGNILSPVIGYADLIDRPECTEAQRQKYVANIRQAAERAFTFLRECNVDHPINKGDS